MDKFFEFDRNFAEIFARTEIYFVGFACGPGNYHIWEFAGRRRDFDVEVVENFDQLFAAQFGDRGFTDRRHSDAVFHLPQRQQFELESALCFVRRFYCRRCRFEHGFDLQFNGDQHGSIYCSRSAHGISDFEAQATGLFEYRLDLVFQHNFGAPFGHWTEYKTVGGRYYLRHWKHELYAFGLDFCVLHSVYYHDHNVRGGFSAIAIANEGSKFFFNNSKIFLSSANF